MNNILYNTQHELCLTKYEDCPENLQNTFRYENIRQLAYILRIDFKNNVFLFAIVLVFSCLTYLNTDAHAAVTLILLIK